MPEEKPSELDNFVRTGAAYFNYFNSNNTQEQKFNGSVELMKAKPRNFLEAWMQCSSLVHGKVLSYETTRNYDLQYLATYCLQIQFITLAHYRIGQNIRTARFLNIKNQKISQELMIAATLTEDTYAKLEIYAALTSFGSATGQFDTILSVRDTLSGMIFDLENQGYINFNLILYRLVADLLFF